MKSLRGPFGCLALLVALAAMLAPPRAARAQLTVEGAWSVLIVTEAGDCDTAYRYAVNIEKGAVRYAGDAAVDFSGRVDAGGHVKVSIRLSGASAEGSGRLSGARGAGTWKGKSATAECSGRWEAERRTQ